MTAVRERAESAPPIVTRRPRGRPRHLLHLLPWLAPAVAWVLGLLYTDTPGTSIALYAGYLAVAVVLPGTLVHRALRGSRGNLPEDIGFGWATGMLLLIIGWAICAAARLQTLLWVWPLLIIALFVVVPRLRRHWRIPPDARRPLPVRWSLIVAAASLAVVMVGVAFWARTPLPPTTTFYYYQDLMYHLALAHEMTRSIPFEVPQLAGDLLRYHYLSDADMAAGSMITKIPLTVVLFRLWTVPIGVAAVLIGASLARELTGKWWAGALGGAVTLFAIPVTFGGAVTAPGGEPLSIASPSQTYAIPLFGLLIAVAVDVLRGRRLGPSWLVVFPLALACAGAKSSTLPTFVVGVVLAVLFLLVRHRDRLLPALALLVLALAAMGVATKIFAGGGAGSLAMQPFSLLFWFRPYRLTLGVYDQIDSTLPLPFGVAEATSDGRLYLVGIVVWWLAAQSPRLIGLVAPVTRGGLREPAVWLLGGMTIAGTGAAWVLWHPSGSQMYFFLTVAPFAALLTVWLLADQARSWRPVVAGLIAGLAWAYLGPAGPAEPVTGALHEWAWVFYQPLLLTAAVAAGTALVVLLVWRLLAGRFAWRAIPAGLLAALLGAGLGAEIIFQTKVVTGSLTSPAAPAAPGLAVTADEMRAALWLNDHAGRDDVIATNVHCQPITQFRSCDARSFWVTGLTGRRTLVESWGYTDQAVAADGTAGLRYMLLPAPYPERFDLNQRVFALGNASDVDRLRREYHVRWLYADARALGGASFNLAAVATLRYQAGSVSIYQL